LARTRTAEPTARDREVATPAKTIWSSAIGGAFLVVLAVGAAIWNHLTPDIPANGLTDTIAVGTLLFVAYTIASLRISRSRLLPDRVEHRDVFRERGLLRAQVAGYRILPSRLLVLVSKQGRAGDLYLPLHVTENPAWVAWLDTLTSLDVEEHNALIGVMESDARLGDTPEQRLERLGSLHRLAGRLSLVGVAIGVWLLAYPRPYELAIAVGVATPLAALAVASVWPGLVTLTSDHERDPMIKLSTFWYLPSLVLAARAVLDIQIVDWPPPLCAGLALATGPFILALRVEKSARRPWMALLSAVVMLAWGWGTVSLANVLLDRAPPARHTAVVVERTGTADKDPGLSLRVADPALGLPLLTELHVSKAGFNAAKIGGRACVGIYPGALGWRYAVVADTASCPAAR
jgi:hypothetical protein